MQREGVELKMRAAIGELTQKLSAPSRSNIDRLQAPFIPHRSLKVIEVGLGGTLHQLGCTVKPPWILTCLGVNEWDLCEVVEGVGPDRHPIYEVGGGKDLESHPRETKGCQLPAERSVGFELLTRARLCRRRQNRREQTHLRVRGRAVELSVLNDQPESQRHRCRDRLGEK